jgi:hypothetical protein
VSLYGGTVSELVASVAGGSMSQWTTASRDAVMGRVLGRALAHEIGHYLLHTRDHSAAGLMRAVQPIDELMGVADPKMVLTPQQQTILRDTWLSGSDSVQHAARVEFGGVMNVPEGIDRVLGESRPMEAETPFAMS